MKVIKICKIPNCGKVHCAQGYCMMHYSRLKRTGSVKKIKKEYVLQTCSVEGCKKPYSHGGYCAMHVQRMKKHGTTDAPFRETKLCSVPGCNKPHYCKGFCGPHYCRNKRWGNPTGGIYHASRFSEEVVADMRERRTNGEKLEYIAHLHNCSTTAVRMRVKDIPKIQWNRNRTCSLCDAKHFGRGFCRTHYEQDLKQRKAREKEKKSRLNNYHVGL